MGIHHFPGNPDILLQGVGGAVDHQGVVADVDSVADDLEAPAVVPMDGAGQGGLGGVGAHHVDKVVDVGVGQKAAAEGEDYGGLELLTGLHDAGKHLYIPDAEVGYGVVFLLRLDQHILGRNKHTKSFL